MIRRMMLLVLGAATMVARRASSQVAAELRGRVTEVATGRPIGDARVEVVGGIEAARTDVDGAFTVRGLAPRAYVVRVRAIGHVSRDVDVTLANGRVTMLDVELEASPTVLGPVVVQSAASTAATGTTTFDRRTIEASGRRDVGELVASVPGVVVTQAGGPGSATHASIRGSSAGEVLVLVDGVALNSSITGEADLSRLSLDGVERVVVHPGAQSARYGSRAMAGVIEVETRRPVRDASVVARAGAWGEQSGSVTLGDNRPVGPLRAGGSLSVDYRTLRGDFDYAVPNVRGGGTSTRTNDDIASHEVTGALTLDGDAANVAIRGGAESMRRGLAGTIVQPSSTARERGLRRSAGIDGGWRRGRFSWTAVSGLAHERSTFTDSTPPFGPPFHDTASATAYTASSVASFGPESATGSVGADVRATDVSSTMLSAGAPHWQRIAGVFAGVRATRALTTDTRLDVDAAARVDESSLTFGTTFSPRVTAALSRGLVTGSLSTGGAYTPPSLADQFFHEGVLVRPNPALRAEHVRNEVEARLSVADVAMGPALASAEVAAFRADVDGMILWMPDYRFIWSPSNNDARRSGWEASARTRLGITELQGTLTQSAVTYAGPVLTGQIAYRPRTTGTTTFSVGPSAVRLEIATRYVGERRTVPGSALNTLDPYWLTDIRVHSVFASRGWTIDGTLGIENAFDARVAMLPDYPFPSRGWTLGVRIRRLDHDR
jgi:vitamin B12 transporter